MFCEDCGKKMIECPSCKTFYCPKCKTSKKKSLIERAFETFNK